MSDRGDSRRARRDSELLAAYVDGIAELSPDERHRVEALLARDATARADHAAVRELLGTLRELPPGGTEPDWAAMSNAIRAAVADAPRPWWRSWRWLAPLTTCAAAVAVLLVIWTDSSPVREIAEVPATISAPSAPEPRDDTVALWLDGAAVEVELAAADLLGPTELDDDPAQADVVDEIALLPASTLGWVDRLDDDALARVEHWLTEPGVPGSPRRSLDPESPATKKEKG